MPHPHFVLILERAHELMERGFCKGFAEFNLPRGKQMRWVDAQRFSWDGAVIAVRNDSPALRAGCLAWLSRFLGQDACRWSDSHTKEEVLAKSHEAIEACREQLPRADRPALFGDLKAKA